MNISRSPETLPYAPDADNQLRHSFQHRLFLVGVTLKALNGVVETTGGLLIFLVQPSAIDDFGQFLTENFTPLIGAPIIHMAADHGSRIFTAAYVLAHGTLKLFMVLGLIRRWMWMYPAAILITAAIIAAGAWRLVYHHSWILPVLMTLDAIIAVVIWREYQRLKVIKALPG